MKVDLKICPACGMEQIRRLVCAPDFPAILFPIEPEKRSSVSTAPLVVMGCEACGHLFLTDIDSEFNQRLYSDYYYLYPYSNLESMVEAYRKPFERVFNLFAHRDAAGRSLLEIGCSEEGQLDLFKTAGYSCTGISPGSNSGVGVTLIDGFYENVVFGQQFDCVVSRFNLEHVIDLELFLHKVHRDLCDGGLFFVQVPNVESFFDSGMIGVFAHEHPQYFNRTSLSAALGRTGFQLEFIRADVSDASIIAVGRKPCSSSFSLERIGRNLEMADTVLEIMMAEHDASFVFYGAGLTLCTLLYIDRRIIDFESRMLVVDDNPVLAGKFMPNTDLQVYRLDTIPDPSGSVLFVFLNSLYHSKVLPRAKALGFRKIFFLDGSAVHEYA
jgi:hypothetical protein